MDNTIMICTFYYYYFDFVFGSLALNTHTYTVLAWHWCHQTSQPVMAWVVGLRLLQWLHKQKMETGVLWALASIFIFQTAELIEWKLVVTTAKVLFLSLLQYFDCKLSDHYQLLLYFGHNLAINSNESQICKIDIVAHICLINCPVFLFAKKEIVLWINSIEQKIIGNLH